MIALIINLPKKLKGLYYRFRYKHAIQQGVEVENNDKLEEQYRNEAARWRNKEIKNQD